MPRRGTFDLVLSEARAQVGTFQQRQEIVNMKHKYHGPIPGKVDKGGVQEGRKDSGDMARTSDTPGTPTDPRDHSGGEDDGKDFTK